VVAFNKSFEMVDPINLTGVWFNPDMATRFGINERYQAQPVGENHKMSAPAAPPIMLRIGTRSLNPNPKP